MIDELFVRLTHLEVAIQQESLLHSSNNYLRYYSNDLSLHSSCLNDNRNNKTDNETLSSPPRPSTPTARRMRRGRVGQRSPDNSPQRTDLDDFLLPYLAQSPHLMSEQMPTVLDALQPHFPHVSTEALASLVREWYRKRREYMTHRVNAYCDKHFCMLTELEVLPGLVADRMQQEAILRAVRLDVTDNDECARQYLVERIAAYFANRRKHDPYP